MKSTTLYLPPRADVPLFWSGIGEEVRQNSRYYWHGLRRGSSCQLLWQLTLEGEGMLQAGSEPPIALGQGSGFLVRIPSDHCYYWKKGSAPWHFVWMMWSGPALGTMLDTLLKTPIRRIVADPESADVRFLRNLIRSGGAASGDPWQISADAYRLLLSICRSSLATRSRSPIRPALPGLSRLLSRPARLPVGKDGMAEQLGLSRFQLYRAVRREAGMSPKEWEARQRVERACRLLKTTRRTMADIAVEVGLPDANYFARFFRRRTGLTPRDWRRMFAG